MHNSGPQNVNSRLDMMYRKISRLQSEIAIMDRQLASAQTKLDSLNRRKSEVTTNKEQLVAEAAQIEARIKTEEEVSISALSTRPVV